MTEKEKRENGELYNPNYDEELKEIAETKMPDLNAGSVEAAMRIIAGSARSMGIKIVD